MGQGVDQDNPDYVDFTGASQTPPRDNTTPVSGQQTTQPVGPKAQDTYTNPFTPVPGHGTPTDPNANVPGLTSPTPTKTPPSGLSGQDTLKWLLANGYQPQAAIDYIHSNNLPGGEAAYYPNFKGGSANVIGMNGGYLNQNGDGSWGWVDRVETGGGGGTNGAQGNGTGFADPAYQALNALAQQRIASLGQPQSFPQLDSLMSQLQQQQAVGRQRAQDLATKWGSRVSELQQPLLTQPQVVQQRALATNNLLQSRDAALANAKASQAARGFAPTSGIAGDQARQINENEANQEAQIQARLQQGNIGADESRRNEATQLQGLITQALNGGDATALQQQAQVADLENQQYQTNQQRATQQLATAQIPVDLTNSGFDRASGAQSSSSGALSSLMALINSSLGQQSNQFGQANSQASGLSQIIQQLMQSFGG